VNYNRLMSGKRVYPQKSYLLSDWELIQVYGWRVTERDCHEYQMGLNSDGYATVRHKKAHRAVWEHHHGPIPDGLIIMHICDNRPCINITHLRLGTRADNMADMAMKERGKQWGHPNKAPVCPNGHPYIDNDKGKGNVFRCLVCARERSRRWRERDRVLQ
jgi:HNH endonuclease